MLQVLKLITTALIAPLAQKTLLLATCRFISLQIAFNKSFICYFICLKRISKYPNVRF